MSAERGYAPVEGTSLYYEVTGDGPAVVLLHGRGADHRMWEDQFAALAGRYRVVAYDLRGFGRSGQGENHYSHAADLDALLDHLGLERVVPVGLSLGGGAALNFAVLHPDRIRGLVTVDSSLGGHRWSPEFTAMMAHFERVAADSGVEAAKELYLASPMLGRLLAHPTAGERLRAMLRDYSGWHWVNADRGLPLEPPAIARLASIRVPTLVIVGEHDMSDFHAIAATLASGIPGARRVMMEGLGHVPSMEDPARFNTLLLGFLDGLPVTVPAAGPGAPARTPA